MTSQDKINRIKELVPLLNDARKVYEQGHDEIMTNTEYDKLYDELKELEICTNFILKDSPTGQIGYEVVSKLEKVKHKTRVLSLDKTKEVSKLGEFLGNKEGLLSWKLDGLSVVLDYKNGELVQAVTRGNGDMGEDVTHNARVIKNLPQTINYEKDLTIRGEVVMSYETFERINEPLPIDERYANPRNLVSGSLRQLDSNICAKRNLEFLAFEVVEGIEHINLKSEQLFELTRYGFSTVENFVIMNLERSVEFFNSRVSGYPYPVDGLVLTFNDIGYSKSLPTTSKHPKHSMAFKWADEAVETTLREIEWNTSRTGLINPVAIFDPIEIEGTTVSRASLHNINIIEKFKLQIGDVIGVIKSNMIIPQVIENYSANNNTHGIGIDTLIPIKCPSCGENTKVENTGDSKMLYCTNSNCKAKLLFQLKHFCSRNAMNIEGLSEATLQKLINLNLVNNFLDIFDLTKEDVLKLEGFGEKSANRLLDNIEKSRQVELPNFIYALGIEGVGRSVAKDLSKYFDYDFHELWEADYSDFVKINGVGDTIAESIEEYLTTNSNVTWNLYNHELEIIKPNEGDSKQVLLDKTFVVTGKVNNFKNRKELQEEIERLGGKVVGSVSKNTDYLINNDKMSSSSKNKKAIELSVPILTEDEFVNVLCKSYS